MKRNQIISLAAVASALALSGVPALASDAFDGVRMVTQQDASHTKAIKGALTVDGAAQKITFNGDGEASIAVPFAEITSMRLDNSVVRLRRPFTGRVEQQEFLTMQYAAPNGDHNYAVFRLNGKSYRDTVAALEAQTGKAVQQTSK